VQAKQAFAFPCTSTIGSTFWRDPSDLNFYPGPPAGRCPFPLASSYRLESMACSPVMHSNLARLVVTLSLPLAGRWRWPALRPGRCAWPAAARPLPAPCPRPGGPPPCPVRAGGGRHPAAQLPSLCGSRGGLPPDRRSDCRPASHSEAHSASAAFNHSPRARTPAHPSVCQRTRQSAHPPASQPATVVAAAASH
jgi:hypothetical protein